VPRWIYVSSRAGGEIMIVVSTRTSEGGRDEFAEMDYLLVFDFYRFLRLLFLLHLFHLLFLDFSFLLLRLLRFFRLLRFHILRLRVRPIEFPRRFWFFSRFGFEFIFRGVFRCIVGFGVVLCGRCFGGGGGFGDGGGSGCDGLFACFHLCNTIP
jgi:hypothetical protein